MSLATVSRVLNYDQTLSVNEATRQKIFETAEAMHYHKSRKTRKSKQKRLAICLWCDQDQEDQGPLLLFNQNQRASIGQEAGT
ncbi:LacI family DNA-binding transcriptional regulator [Lactobacillus delbrueckii subsp. bulgaricus]|uniref:LacI family DNA-binding transcriptional regulator n=1 Tax=Lactobacillus delbrueckii TaxID=1584 RepID=UPI0037C8E22F